jgi:hypothetical protein
LCSHRSMSAALYPFRNIPAAQREGTLRLLSIGPRGALDLHQWLRRGGGTSSVMCMTCCNRLLKNKGRNIEGNVYFIYQKNKLDSLPASLIWVLAATTLKHEYILVNEKNHVPRGSMHDSSGSVCVRDIS